MRHVARLLLPAIVLLASFPPVASAANECVPPMCQTVTVPQAGNTFYVYATAIAGCPPLDNRCHGAPPAVLIGIVWEETNRVAGLQRASTLTPNGWAQPDKPHLA